jgi:hypothetical protein
MRTRPEYLARWMLAVLTRAFALAIGACVTLIAAADDGAKPREPIGPDAQSIRAAVSRVLPLLVKASSVDYPRHRDCFSCHNQAVPAFSLALARPRGLAVEAESLRAIAEHTEADLASAIDDYKKGQGQPGGIIRAGYALWTLETTGWTPDETTAAVAHYLSVVTGKNDHWPTSSNRPPSEASAFTATAFALRGLRAFNRPTPAPKPNGGAPYESADQPPQGNGTAVAARALAWLIKEKPRDTEDRVFRLWGLKEAGASGDQIARAAADLLQHQRPDGGWSQLDLPANPAKGGADKAATRAASTPSSAFESDAYATGSVLVALAQAGGMAPEQPAYRRGLEFLIRSQRPDGSWFVKSRSRPFQTYFESGFPHGPDQFISASATAWAAAALSLALPVHSPN